jgi:hypothetical protein
MKIVDNKDISNKVILIYSHRSVVIDKESKILYRVYTNPSIESVSCEGCVFYIKCDSGYYGCHCYINEGVDYFRNCVFDYFIDDSGFYYCHRCSFMNDNIPLFINSLARRYL